MAMKTVYFLLQTSVAPGDGVPIDRGANSRAEPLVDELLLVMLVVMKMSIVV